MPLVAAFLDRERTNIDSLVAKVCEVIEAQGTARR